MENRWSARTPFTAQVTLHHNSLPVAQCRASNIGLGGLFIKTGPLTYPRNSILEVDIKLNTDLGPERFRLRTCVVNSSETGLGLMFLDSNCVVSRSIRQILLGGADVETPMHNFGLATLPAMA